MPGRNLRERGAQTTLDDAVWPARSDSVDDNPPMTSDEPEAGAVARDRSGTQSDRSDQP